MAIRALFESFTNGEGDIYVTDGTSVGTQILLPANADANGLVTGVGDPYIALGNRVLFSGFDAAANPGLWISNGTAGGTKEIVTLPHGGATAFLAYNGKVVFSADDKDSQGNVRQGNIWITDGTAAGTIDLALPGYNSGSGILVGANNFAVLNGKVLYSALDANGRRNLYSTDGTSPGTEFTGLGSATYGLSPSFLAAVGSVAVFAGEDSNNNNGLWATDGTAGGTHEIMEPYAYAGGQLSPVSVSSLSFYGPSGYVAGFGVVGNKGFFNGPDYLNTNNTGIPAWAQLWATDGTTGGTVQLTSTAYGIHPVYFGTVNGLAAIEGIGANGADMWISNGTMAGTSELHLGTSGLALQDENTFIGLGTRMIFRGDTLVNGFNTPNLYVTDGTLAGTSMLNAVGAATTGLDPQNVQVIGNQVFFSGRDLAGNVALWKTDGTSAGTVEVSTIATAPHSFVAMPSILSADFAGGGTSDVLWYNAASGTVDDWLMSNGTPTNHIVGYASSTVSIEGFGDFNGNGTSDILWENPTNGVVGDWLMSNNQPSWQQIGQGSTTMNIAGVGDFNGDGTSDILWQNPTNNYVGIWQMLNNVATWEAVAYGSTTMNIAGIGDFTGNGKDDILWLNPTNNLVGMWAMNGSQATWSLISQGSTTMNIAGVGDFNGDGTSDILWENQSNGTVGFWGMSGGQATSWNVVATANTSYQVAGIGDYYGNGTDDILWRSASTGDVGTWAMNNGQATWHDLAASSTAFNVVKS